MGNYYKNPALVVSQETGQQPLYLALELANKYGINDFALSEKYGLNRPTLGKIRNGESLPRAYEKYLATLVRALNNVRLKYQRKGDEEMLASLTKDMLDMLLVHAGIATDLEMQVMDKEYSRDLIMNSIKCKVTGG